MFFYSFSFNGHRNAQTIKDIKEHDLSDMEEFSLRLPHILRQVVTSEKRKNADETTKKLIEIFFGIYSNGVEFKFPPGDKKLIISMAKIVSEKISDEGYAYFQINSDSLFEGSQLLLPAPVGNLFHDGCISKDKITANRKDDDSNASDESLLEAPGGDKIKELVEYLEASLRHKFSKKKGINTTERGWKRTKPESN